MTQRANHELAYVLHHYDWSETSLIVEALTRQHGRVALVAKGAKRPSSRFRPVLLPMQKIYLSWGGRGDIRSLKHAEWGGGPVMPCGQALLSGYYVNELLLRLLARDDPYPALFDAYDELAAALSARRPAASWIRAFEILLLHWAGWLPALDVETANLQDVQEAQNYRLLPDAGVQLTVIEDDTGASGRALLQLQEVLSARGSGLSAVFRVVRGLQLPDRTALRRQLRGLLDHHGGVVNWRTPALMHTVARWRSVR